MIELILDENDSAKFISLAESLVNGAVRRFLPERVYVVKIDKWFPAKWCEFSGKVHGSVGIWNRKLTLHPFIPSRVIAEISYRRVSEKSDYSESVSKRRIHVRQASSDNLKRFVDRFDPGAAFFWYSGATIEIGMGCLMGYLPSSEGYSTWYAEIRIGDQATFGLLRGISRRELVRYARISSLRPN